MRTVKDNRACIAMSVRRKSRQIDIRRHRYPPDLSISAGLVFGRIRFDSDRNEDKSIKMFVLYLVQISDHCFGIFV
jgi:hypothetical protein